jgi:hypothetical protein
VGSAVGDDPAVYRDKIVRVLQDHAARFGPYPWPEYTVALTPAVQGGIEYPGHVMQGPGTIGRTTSHELGHQWFYGLVGDDQARDPWLDEGLASWAEAREENTLGAFVRHPMPAAARGRAGLPMTYWSANQGAYYSGVYVQPVQALAALGDPATVDCALRLYIALNAYRIARPADLVSVMERVIPGATAVLQRYGL